MSNAGDTDPEWETGTSDDPKRRKRDRESPISDIISAYEKRRKQGTGKSPKGKSPKSKGGITTEMLECIKSIIQSTIQVEMDANFTKMTKALQAKVESQKEAIQVLEADLFEKANKVDRLEEQLKETRRELSSLHVQVEDMERHERGVNLILTCKKFGRRRQGEDVRMMAVRALREHFPHIPLSPPDLAAAHRLPRDNVVICAFFDRTLRNQFYYERMRLRNSPVPAEERLYLSESLTRLNRERHNELLTMKSKGRIWSVFTQNGLPGYKLTQHSNPVRVTSDQQVRDLWKMLRERRQAGGHPATGAVSVPAPAGGRPTPASGRPAAGERQSRPAEAGASSSVPLQATSDRDGPAIARPRPENCSNVARDACPAAARLELSTADSASKQAEQARGRSSADDVEADSAAADGGARNVALDGESNPAAVNAAPVDVSPSSSTKDNMNLPR